MVPIVLVHGGSFAGSCWDGLLPGLDGPALAVDLPGRGCHPAPPASVTIEAASRSVVGDIDEAGFDEVVLVGHSLAGSSLPATMDLLGRRVRYVVFVACTVPPHGQSVLDTLPVEVQQMVRAAQDTEPGVLDEELAHAFFGNDLDAEQFAWCLSRMVPEGVTLVMEQVDHTPLRSPVPRVWIRPLRDAIVDPVKQLVFAHDIGDCPVIDLEAGHMCMISQPRRLAEILNGIADL